jgi:hypothetical protein
VSSLRSHVIPTEAQDLDQGGVRPRILRRKAEARRVRDVRIDESRHRESSQLTGSPGSPRAHETRPRRTP